MFLLAFFFWDYNFCRDFFFRKKTHEPASNNLEQQPIDQDVRNMTQKWIEQVQNSQPLVSILRNISLFYCKVA